MITQATLDRLQDGLDTPLKEVLRLMRRKRMTWAEIAEWFDVDIETIVDAAKHLRIYGRRPKKGFEVKATRAQIEHAAEVTGYTVKTVLTMLYKRKLTIDEILKLRRRRDARIDWQAVIGMTLADYLRKYNPTAKACNIADRIHKGWDIQTAINTPVRKRNGRTEQDYRRAA